MSFEFLVSSLLNTVFIWLIEESKVFLGMCETAWLFILAQAEINQNHQVHVGLFTNSFLM